MARKVAAIEIVGGAHPALQQYAARHGQPADADACCMFVRVTATMLAIACGPVWAGEADVIAAVAHRTAPGVCDFDITIRSRDTGW